MILIIGGAYQGKYDFALNTLGLKEENILNSFHMLTKRMLEDGKSIEKETEKIIEDKDIQAVISDEIGCGVVPMDKADREWREQTGRALCKIAAASYEVYRIQCGVPLKIKG